MTLLSTSYNEHTDHKFQKLAHNNTQITNKRFDTCIFKDCSFRETIFQGCVFQDCTFQGCDLSLMMVKQCVFTHTQFVDSQLMGVDWTLADWPKFNTSAPVSFVNCSINYATFIGLTLKAIMIINCMAKDVDFSETDLTKANCAQTDFTNSRFSNTNLTQANFEGATGYMINATTNKLKQTKFSLPEAMSLLYSLDIVLVE